MNHYAYDIFGNRTNVTANGQTNGIPIPSDGISNVSYNTLTNRITSAGFEYDYNGNQTRALAPDGQTYYRYEYDDANRLVVIKQDNGTVIQTQEFGIGNNRLSVTDSASNQRTYYQGAIEYLESNNSGVLSWSKSYVYLGDSVLSTTTPNGAGGESIEYHHPDALGTRLVSNLQTGTVTENVNLPFGTQIANESTNTSNKRKFTSYDRSSVTGLDYAVNRTYDSKQGRFTQVDPIGISAASLMNPQSLNMYSYCENDPINYTDPSGLFLGKLFKWIGKALKWIAIAVTVAVVVLSAVVVPGSTGILAKVLKTVIGILAKIGSVIQTVSGGLIAAEGTIALADLGLKGLWAAAGVGVIANHFTSRQRRQDDDVDHVTVLLNPWFLELIRRNNRSVIPDEMVFCQVAIEGHRPGAPINTADSNIQPPHSPSHRGLLQISPEAAGRAGLGNGRNAPIGNRSDEAVRAVNPDYIDNIYKVGTNIRTGTAYLQIRINENKGNIDKGLEGYRRGVGTPEGKFYVRRIRACAEKVKNGDITGGLRVIYPRR